MKSSIPKVEMLCQSGETGLGKLGIRNVVSCGLNQIINYKL